MNSGAAAGVNSTRVIILAVSVRYLRQRLLQKFSQSYLELPRSHQQRHNQLHTDFLRPVNRVNYLEGHLLSLEVLPLKIWGAVASFSSFWLRDAMLL